MSGVVDVAIGSDFVYAGSRWQDIYAHLAKDGFDVYSPGIKVGECASEYVVVKNDGSQRVLGYSTDDDMYSVMCYVPRLQYSKLEPFVMRVKESMKKLQPMVVPTGAQTPSYYDDTYKAHMVSIEYKNHKKVYGL